MIIWVNGTFGVGKTTVSALLAEAVPGARIFDAEEVGYLLQPVLKSVPVRNFQEWPPWRHLVVETAAQILGYVGGTLVVPQTVLVEQYWDEISSGLEKAGIPVRHFVLDADRETLVRRIETDTVIDSPKVRRWRIDHVQDYEQALPWLRRKGRIVDTTTLTPAEITTVISDAVGRGPTRGTV
ncbi:AAA family ATPase [Catenulispora pinisilvae]|uniref:AAA family ATPase n=1 Tax=Catenulispora pinisilvae TaxID=2705253 RepID=UPI0018918311|nr:AAA family ATPase [Catenulispora pinisilvae]